MSISLHFSIELTKLSFFTQRSDLFEAEKLSTEKEKEDLTVLFTDYKVCLQNAEELILRKQKMIAALIRLVACLQQPAA